MTHNEAQALRDMGLTPMQVARLKKAVKGFSIAVTVGGSNTASIPLPGTAKYLLGIRTYNKTAGTVNFNTQDVVLNNEKIIDTTSLGFTDATLSSNSNSEGYMELFRVLTGKDTLQIQVTTAAGGADQIYYSVYYLL
jgi:hypothetical protein